MIVELSVATSIPFDGFVGLSQRTLDTYQEVLEDIADEQENG